MMTLQVDASEHGLVSIRADDPRNIAATGLSLAEALSVLVPIIRELQEAGTVFECLEGVKLQ